MAAHPRNIQHRAAAPPPSSLPCALAAAAAPPPTKVLAVSVSAARATSATYLHHHDPAGLSNTPGSCISGPPAKCWASRTVVPPPPFRVPSRRRHRTFSTCIATTPPTCQPRQAVAAAAHPRNIHRPGAPRALSPPTSHLRQMRCSQCRSTPRAPHPRPTCISTAPPACRIMPGGRIGGPAADIRCLARLRAYGPPDMIRRSRLASPWSFYFG